jgi:hypothetical protein
MDVSGRDIAPWAAGCRVCGRDQERDAGMHFIEAPGVKVERYSFRQDMAKRFSNLPKRC